MAFTVATLWRTNDAVEFTVIASADADTTSPSLAHNMGANAMVTLIPVLQAPAALSLWATAIVDQNNITVTKATTAGSGNAGIQLRVRVERQG